MPGVTPIGAAEFECELCGRKFEDGIDAGQHEMWHARKAEGERVAAYLATIPVGTEFTVAGAGRAYSATYRKNPDGTLDQVYAVESPLVRNMDAAHLGFCIGYEAVAQAVARTAR